MKKYIYKGKENIEYDLEYGLSLGYDTSLDLLHPKITWKHIWLGSCEGDVISIGFDKDKNWYYKNNSYGSCSGCDWVESISCVEDAEEFLKQQETLDKPEDIKEYVIKEVKNCWDFDEEDLNELLKFIEENK